VLPLAVVCGLGLDVDDKVLDLGLVLLNLGLAAEPLALVISLVIRRIWV